MTEPERRWTDLRLDDRFAAIASELKDLRKLETNVGVFGEELRNLRRDVDGAALSIKEHRGDFNAYVEDQEKTQEDHRKERAQVAETHRLERKSDRRWMIGTVLTSAALIVAAVGLLLGHIG